MADRQLQVNVSAAGRVLRRVAGVALAGLIAVTGFQALNLPLYDHAPLGVRSQTFDAGSVETRMAFVRRVDALADQLPEAELLTNQPQMISWAVEILPYMAYEGVLSGPAIVPMGLDLFWRLDSAAFHLGGQAACRLAGDIPFAGPIWLNGRYTNPMSASFGREVNLSVLVHELVHIQSGPFCTGASEDLEANTQIATVEVMAAMVNHGNKAVLRPLLLELRGMWLASLQYDLSRDAYMAFLRSISDDPTEISRAEKSFRFWSAGATEQLAEILRKYNLVPVLALTECVHDGTVERIQLPFMKAEPLGVGATRYIFDHRPFACDDLQYALLHLDEFVSNLVREDPNAV